MMSALVLGPIRLPWRLLRRAVMISVIVASVVGVVTLLTPRRYAAGFAFVPQVSDAGNSGLSSIASQLGVKLGSVDLTQTPLFYSELLGSKSFMSALAGGHYDVEVDGRSVDTLLFAWLKAPGASEAQRRERGGILLRDRVVISSSSRTGIVRFVVAVTDSALARQISLRALAQLDSFNLRTKQSQARAERSFLEMRGDSLRALLHDSESALVRFDDRNRAALLSPGLRTERERLSRDSRVLDNVYQLVRQQLERARMEEVRNTPVVTVVEETVSPAWPERRFLLYKTAAATAATFVLWVALFVAIGGSTVDGILPRTIVVGARRVLGGGEE